MPKVLVVDDSLSVRKVVQRALESRRIEVLSAASGTEALEQIGREAPDLIVCDVIMPDMDGYQICDFVKKHPTLGHTPAHDGFCTAPNTLTRLLYKQPYGKGRFQESRLQCRPG